MSKASSQRLQRGARPAKTTPCKGDSGKLIRGISGYKSLRICGKLGKIGIFGHNFAFHFGHCVVRVFVFIHIVGSICIFNIFTSQRPISDLLQGAGKSPQPPQVRAFHSLHEQRILIFRGHEGEGLDYQTCRSVSWLLLYITYLALSSEM
jgi:hypothetical protein